MSKVTGIIRKKGREKQVQIFLDGQYACTLLAELILKEGIKTGQELSVSQVDALSGKDRRQRCLNAAVRYLGYRPRSVAEIKERLHRHGYDTENVEMALSTLEKQGLADDAAFARFWIDNREAFSPRSRRLAALELRRKGLSKGVIEQVTGEINESESAYRAALGKARRLSSADYVDFRRRLGGYLGRRGFGYDIIKETVDRVWRERSGNAVSA